MKRTHTQAKKAFLEAYASYADSIFRFCLLRLGERERAEDMVQEVFMKTWNYMQEGQEIKSMRAFLYTTAGHLVIDEYRRRKPQSSLDELSEETGFDPAGDDGSDKMIDIHDGGEAMKLLSRLPDSYREVIYMRYVGELSLSEMSDILSQSENTIAVRIHRGIEMLKQIWNRQ